MERIKKMVADISGAYKLNNIKIERIVLLCPDPRLMQFYATYIAILGAFPVWKLGGAFFIDEIRAGYKSNIKEVGRDINKLLSFFPDVSEFCPTVHAGICKEIHAAIPNLNLENEVEIITGTLEKTVGVFEQFDFVQNGIIKKIVPIRFDIGFENEIIPTRIA